MEEKNKQVLSDEEMALLSEEKNNLIIGADLANKEDKTSETLIKMADFVQKSTKNVQKGAQNEKKSQKSGLNGANFEKTYAKCNVCGRIFEIKLRELETKETIVRYFNCTWCRQRYPVYTKHKKRTRRNKKGN